MNLIPFLDVLLVLLLVLMVATPVVQQAVQVELPQAHASKTALKPATTHQIILEISGPGCYTLIVQGHRLENLPPQQIIIHTQKRLQEYPGSQFLIGGSARVPYEEILKGLSLLHQSGVTAVGLMTKPL
jgi:biopolymer transport protein TolR